MNYNEIRKKAIKVVLQTITSGTIEAKTCTYTQNSTSKADILNCVINAYYFEHPIYGGILIDGGFSSDFNTKRPYGNLNSIMKIFQKLNGVIYLQERNEDTIQQLKKFNAKPKHIFLTHRHPDHTSAISYLPKNIPVWFGKSENTLFYSILTSKHLKGKRKELIDFEKGIPFEEFDKVIDIFGDGSFLAISTKGHTKDHISYLVNGRKTYLIIGDAELTKEAINKGLYVNSDYGKRGEQDARRSAEKIRAFSNKYSEVELCYSHDL